MTNQSTIKTLFRVLIAVVAVAAIGIWYLNVREGRNLSISNAAAAFRQIIKSPPIGGSCEEQLAVYRSEATETEIIQRMTAPGYTECDDGRTPPYCTGTINMPQYETSQHTVGTGVLGRLKIVNKSNSPVTLREITINNRTTRACHVSGEHVLQQGDFIVHNTTECGDVIVVQLKTDGGLCEFHW
jgi:hypothetical protein